MTGGDEGINVAGMGDDACLTGEARWTAGWSLSIGAAGFTLGGTLPWTAEMLTAVVSERRTLR